MTTNSLRPMRELTDNEMASVAGGVIGAIPGYFAPLPSSLFAAGGTCSWYNTTPPGSPSYLAPTGYGTCQNNYVGASGWMY